MITIEKDLTLQFSAIGLFDSEAEWIHPTVTIETYEIIFPMAGEIKIREGEVRYTVRPGEMLLLEPHVEHGGFEKNTSRTSFYWLHFQTNRIADWQIPKHASMPHSTARTLREIMHLSQAHTALAEVTLAKFLLEGSLGNDYKNKIAYEVREYIRIHVRKNLRVDGLAKHFGYSPDHLSRLYKQEFGHDLKEAITRQRLADIESLLINSDASIKEVASMSGFEEENAFVKFFKYHAGLSPRTYRNRFFHIHMNNH